MQAFHELLSQNLERDATRTAVVDGARDVSYADLESEVARAASWLVEAGVRPGDRVCVHLLKGIEEIAAMFAISRVGGANSSGVAPGNGMATVTIDADAKSVPIGFSRTSLVFGLFRPTWARA